MFNYLGLGLIKTNYENCCYYKCFKLPYLDVIELNFTLPFN